MSGYVVRTVSPPSTAVASRALRQQNQVWPSDRGDARAAGALAPTARRQRAGTGCHRGRSDSRTGDGARNSSALVTRDVTWISAVAALRWRSHPPTGCASCEASRMGSRSACSSRDSSPITPGYRSRKYKVARATAPLPALGSNLVPFYPAGVGAHHLLGIIEVEVGRVAPEAVAACFTGKEVVQIPRSSAWPFRRTTAAPHVRSGTVVRPQGAPSPQRKRRGPAPPPWPRAAPVAASGWLRCACPRGSRPRVQMSCPSGSNRADGPGAGPPTGTPCGPARSAACACACS